MSDETLNQGTGQVTGPGIPPAAESTAVERIVSTAASQASEAATAFSQGQLTQQGQIDPLADSDDRLIGLLSYVTQLIIPVVMPLIVLLSESSKKRPFQRYHAVQSLAFTMVFWSVFLLGWIAVGIIQIIPLIGVLIGFMAACLTPIYWFGGALVMLYYGYKAYKGYRFAIPGLTSFLVDQKWL
jgi:uncharacterized membrane protein